MVQFKSVVCGPVAQLGARFHGMEEVKGSNPFRSTKLICNIRASESSPTRRRPSDIAKRWGGTGQLE